MFAYRSPLDRPLMGPLAWEELFRGFDWALRDLDRDGPLTSFGHAPSEINEEQERFVLRVEIPGMGQKDVNVALDNGVLTVSAEGKTVATPDTALTSFSVVSRGKNPEELADNNNQKVSAAIKFVKSQGVEDKDVKTEPGDPHPA